MGDFERLGDNNDGNDDCGARSFPRCWTKPTFVDEVWRVVAWFALNNVDGI